jgi:hypothetical protein
MRQRHQDHRLPAVAVRVAGRLFGAASSHFSDLQMSDRLRAFADVRLAAMKIETPAFQKTNLLPIPKAGFCPIY